MSNQEQAEYKARIIEYGIQMPDGKAPFVIIKLAYEKAPGFEASINYLGSLSDKARPYTIDRLKSIGYKGKLASYEEIAEWIEQRVELQTEDLTLVVGDDEYNGRKRLKVKYFYGKKVELTDEERQKLAMQVFNFVNKKGGDKPAAKPAKAAKPAPKKANASNLFDSDEELDLF